jgi:uncharacterized membrane protein YpjA
MLPFALCMVVIGAILGLWFKALVLVPVIGAAWLFIAVGGEVPAAPEASLLLLFVSVQVMLISRAPAAEHGSDAIAHSDLIECGAWTVSLSSVVGAKDQAT